MFAVSLNLALLALLLIAPLGAQRAVADDAVKASVTAAANGGYARLVFTMSDYDAASVRQQGSVLIISFKKPIDVSVDKLATQAPDYIGAARRDPDGTAVRLALAQKVTFNTITAGEQYFVDLMPEGWSGPPPGLPQEVVEDLARRARDAEQLVARERRAWWRRKGFWPVRVRVANEHDLHALCVCHSRSDFGRGGAIEARAHADLRCAAAVRSRRRRRSAARCSRRHHRATA